MVPSLKPIENCKYHEYSINCYNENIGKDSRGNIIQNNGIWSLALLETGSRWNYRVNNVDITQGDPTKTQPTFTCQYTSI